ncbi:esterase-like activity of phytase family protein [Porticoccus sp. W117]|uniref:esterase-like activity of phytase family protein n=1 Tax=Porticoccus sp. W117 TaxID=3054777 RepID=UPI002597E318|nr:esterase-like activity of phytase family protein [Porticoccus sp. W117]MDM3870474.1 esterase-like activity of phytase family protein [Porticoccus sp. W117]
MALKTCLRALVAACACSHNAIAQPEYPVVHQLSGWASLSHTVRLAGHTSGQFISPQLGIQPPFISSQPVPGWSGLLLNQDGTFTAMPDNGYGSKGNSADYVLGFYRVEVNFKTEGDGSRQAGTVSNLSFTSFNDRHKMLSNGRGIDFPITADFQNYRSGDGVGRDSGIAVHHNIRNQRLLTGYDFDVESIAQASDGSYWVGEEFGPFLLHFDQQGTLLNEPVPHPQLISPNHPMALAMPDTANHGSSRGFESIAFDNEQRMLYVVPEAAPQVDTIRPVPGDERVVSIYQFDTASQTYTDVIHHYRKDGPQKSNHVVIGDMVNVGNKRFVLIERDSKFGANAKIKRLYLVDFSAKDKTGVLKKKLLVDLLNINDPNNIGGYNRAKQQRFAMPFDSIECLTLINPHTLAVAIDTNFPSEDGRTAGVPDDTEIITLFFPTPLGEISL